MVNIERYAMVNYSVFSTLSGLLIDLISELASIQPSQKYHDNEDALAEYVIEFLKWPIQKVGKRWLGNDYFSILEQGGFRDITESNLVQAAAGRVQAAIKFGQRHFDEMEISHRKILAHVLAVIIYHRWDGVEA